MAARSTHIPAPERIPGAAWVGLLGLATARATRFITSDFLGEWTIAGPAKKWAHRHESHREELEDMRRAEIVGDPIPTPPAVQGWRSKLVKGLDCPYCVGFWIGGAVLVIDAVLPRALRPAWKLLIGTAALNYVTGHISSRIDG